MHWVAYGNTRVDVFEYLLSKDANFNAKDKFGKKLIHIATQQNPYVETMKYLLSKGADVNAKDGGGMTPLHYEILLTADISRYDVLKYLISKGANVNTSVL